MVCYQQERLLSKILEGIIKILAPNQLHAKSLNLPMFWFGIKIGLQPNNHRYFNILT
jgi:hypothetical protein